MIDKLQAIGHLYNVVLEETESFEEEHIGADLAYLVGAIACGERCEWPSDRPLVKVLRRVMQSGNTWVAERPAVEFALGHIDVTSGAPVCCPFCGGEALHNEVAEWFAVADEDKSNNAKLNEYQCAGACEGRSFWV